MSVASVASVAPAVYFVDLLILGGKHLVLDPRNV